MILVSGEALIDMLPVEQSGQRLFLPAVGGSPYNVALALGRLGSPVKFLGRISEDPFGKMLAQTLEHSRVDLSMCPRTQALSTLGFVMFEGGQRSPSYLFYTDNTSGCALAPADIPATLPSDVRVLHFGSFSIAAEPIGTALEKLLSLKTPQTLVSLDPNIRPFLIRDSKSYLTRLNYFLAHSDLVKLSEEDLAWLHPGMTPRAFCEKHLKLGAGLVVVTCGGKGVFAMNGQACVELPAVPVTVIDTVGAGDTFQAAMLAWMCSRHNARPEALKELCQADLAQMLRFAAHAAAITCSRAGCNPPWRNDFSAEADAL